MRNLLRALLALALLAAATPGRTEPACGSDTPADPDAALGKDVWLNGYCKSFLPCRLALEQFHACEAAESFLSKLGAKEGMPLTDEQVQSALSQTAGTAADVAKAKAPMSRNVARIERDRVGDMDNKAASLVQSNCGGFGCSQLLESMVDPVIREAEALNANPEYLAHMPRYAPIASVDAAARFGWARQDGFWVQAAPRPQAGSSSTSTLGAYLLSADECKKMRDTLDREIKANTAKEPDNVSFFEGECAPQQASYADDVRSWRALLATQRPAPNPAEQEAANDTAADTALLVAAEGELTQWNEQQLAEEQRYEAEAIAAAEQQAQRDTQNALQESTGSQPSLAALMPDSPGGTAARSGGIPPNKRPGWKPPSCEELGNAVDRVLLNHPFLMHPDNKGMPYTETYILMRKRMLELEQAHPACASRQDLHNSLVQALETDKQTCRSYLSNTPGDCENGRDPGGILPEVAVAIAEVSGDREKTPDSALYLSCRSKMSDISSSSTDYFLQSRKNGALSSLQIFAWRDYQTLKLLEGECRAEPRLARRIEVQRVISQRSADECSQLTAGGNCDVDREPGR